MKNFIAAAIIGSLFLVGCTNKSDEISKETDQVDNTKVNEVNAAIQSKNQDTENEEKNSNNNSTVTEENENSSEVEEVELTAEEIEKKAINDRRVAVMKSVKNIIETDFTFDTSLKNIELNRNIGTDNPDDYIALIYLSYDQPHTENTTLKWIDQYTGHLGALLAEENDISSLSIFWETPRFKQNWNTAEFALTKKDGVFYFESKNYDQSVFR